MTQAAPLTSSEQITLRRVAYGEALPGSLNAKDLIRLRTLGLIEGPLLTPVVTASGRRCFNSLARPIPLAETTIEDALADMLQSLRQARQQRRNKRQP